MPDRYADEQTRKGSTDGGVPPQPEYGTDPVEPRRHGGPNQNSARPPQRVLPDSPKPAHGHNAYGKAAVDPYAPVAHSEGHVVEMWRSTRNLVADRRKPLHNERLCTRRHERGKHSKPEQKTDCPEHAEPTA